MEEKKVEEAAAKSSGISSSKAKREEKAKKAAELKKSAMLSKIIWVVVGILLAALVVVLIVNKAVVASKQITASNDYSAMLEDTGMMKGVTASKCVNLCDYKNIVVPLSEIEYTDEEVDADIQQALEVHKVLNSEEGTVADGDKINLDYVGKIDGEEFEGGNTNGNGYDLTIGSGSFIEGFEDQLIGAKVGDMVTVDVTFPEGYSNADVAGKDAQFDCTINGIYELGTFDDDFVKEYYSDYADTVEGYRQYLKDTNYEKRFEAYVKSYVVDNSEVTSYPAKYLKHLKETTYYDDLQTYDYMNQMYIQYSGSGFSSFEEYIGKSMDEYFESLDETCKSSEKTSLICQAIIEQEGITLTDDDLKASVGEETSDEDLQTMITTYGKGYLMQSAIATRAYEIAKENAVVQ